MHASHPAGCRNVETERFKNSILSSDSAALEAPRHCGARSRNAKMATDLGELLVPYMPTIRVPRTGDRVFKSECAFSFDSPESEGGLYVCMNTFLGFGREHVERHYRKTGQSVYMHLKRHVKEKATGAAGGAIPRRRNGKVFLGEEFLPLTVDIIDVPSFIIQSLVDFTIYCLRSDGRTLDLELNRDFNGEDYEYEDEAKLVIFPDHFEIPLPNIEELPALVTIACDAVLNAPSAYKKQEPESWEEEIQVSRHARSLRQLDNGVRIPPSGWKCQKCEMRENLWLNLTDGAVLCGKWFFDGSGGNGHALEHYRETNYPLAVKLDTITPDGADVYSFEEEEAVLDPHISDHLSHFGIDMLQMQKRRMVTTQTITPGHGSVNGKVIQESGMKLKAVFGSGYTGIKNLGNSCYISTVLQVLFSIPDFQRMYVGNLQRIFDYSPLDPSQDFATQMAKLGHGLLSGQYAKPPMKSELIEQVMKEEYKVLNWHQQKGVSPRMLKSLVSQGHPEFSSNRQQDAQEFLLHMINQVERNSAGSENPSDAFRFLVEERIQCCQSRRVRYTQRVDYCIQLPAPIEAATNREELLAYEVKRKEAEDNMRAPPEPVRARIPFTACLQAFTEPENVPDFWSSALQAKSAGVKVSDSADQEIHIRGRLGAEETSAVNAQQRASLNSKRHTQYSNLAIDVPDFLDLSRMRATGLQAGEEELPDLMPPIVLPEDTRDNSMSSIDSPEIDETAVMQLAEMGFPLEACRKAVYYTGNMGPEMAFNWIIAHMEEPDPGPSTSDSPMGATPLGNSPPEESVSILTSMGFPRAHSIQALKATNNNLERALDWIFTHPEEEESDALSDMADTEPNDNAFSNANSHSDSTLSPDRDTSGPRIKDGPGRYELFAFISHMGASTMSGHYVCHIKKEGRTAVVHPGRLADNFNNSHSGNDGNNLSDQLLALTWCHSVSNQEPCTFRLKQVHILHLKQLKWTLIHQLKATECDILNSNFNTADFNTKPDVSSDVKAWSKISVSAFHQQQIDDKLVVLFNNA
ncbi:Ubiquitin carboxyl-terminal hydrolase 13 [Collichthys lucidus]|uniref:Ubiquitin carboxyl-terminal hydrolase 13 n=1 Tax=Collichthys lucidus TaxID=240159 RepID=A0A4U5UJZ9_COLLU|nr:Ubiquitin carboxyl-terminal hydrolase 13 [Collichthys lucidus]